MKPLSTYRLQLNKEFGFGDALDRIPYFEQLGVSHLYLSPILTARPGSLHGYDTCDHSTINPELGGEDGFRALACALKARGMGIVLDFVPNHMAADPTHNPWWRDVLANGPSSPYSDFFDIDWEPVKAELKNKILLPILGGPYGEVLEAGQLRLSWEKGWFRLRYWEHDLPLNPMQVRLILRHDLDWLEAALGEGDADLREFLSIIFQLDHMPAYTDSDPERRADRRREAEVARERLGRLASTRGEVRAHLERNVERFNGKVGDPGSFDLLHELLEQQPYRLAYWRTALHEINYRRFFDVNELAALRMESDEVFERTHQKIFQLAREGLIEGIRLDHVDGLYDPRGYCTRLRSELGTGFYIVVEKILSGNEPLDEQLQVDGTTGYGALNRLNRLFVRGSNARQILRVYSRFVGGTRLFKEEVREAKQLIITSSLASELNLLAHELNRISESNRRHRDFTLESLREALREIVVSFDVYRTYITDRGINRHDAGVLERAVQDAIRRNPAIDSSIFQFILENLQPGLVLPEGSVVLQRRLRFAMKFQQYTAPVQAKGVEDTAFYRYCPLLSLNEVGGDPDDFGAGAAQAVHEAAGIRQAHWPHAMIATSTHDTKRGEDARARINVLSEIPDEWRDRLRLWSRMNARFKLRVDGSPAPDRNDEYLYYQALLGAWPDGASRANEELVARMKAHVSKAVKEAKVHTSWVNPSNEYDAAAERFVEGTLGNPAFLASFVPFAQRLAKLGVWNSIGQLTLKLTLPGVPDFYQGSEFWDLSLVDPDNRRGVDFSGREAALRSGSHEKLTCMAALLRLRRREPDLFLRGSYQPISFAGPQADHLFGFVRRHAGKWLCTIVARWPASWECTDSRGPTLAVLPDTAPLAWREEASGESAAAHRSERGPALDSERTLRGRPAVVLIAG